jgi:hypothetical protein
MKIREWLGYNEDASRYLLRPGELQILNNLQSRRPGMLTGRKGIEKFYGRYDEERIVGAFRNANLLGDSSDLIVFQRGLAERELTNVEVDEGVYPFKFVWQLRRILENESRILEVLDIAPNGTSIHNMCIAEDRHGRLYVIYGNGVKPRMYDPNVISNPILEMGLNPPKIQPSVSPTGDGFFIENVNVDFAGGSYNSAPDLTLEGGDPDRPAKIKAIMEKGMVVGADIIDGGANYKKPPAIETGVSSIGSGFRAKGNRSNASTTIVGFNDRDAGGVTGGVLPATHTYGSKDSTKDQTILYKSERSAVESALLDRTCFVDFDRVPGNITIYNVPVPVTTTAGISVGDWVHWDTGSLSNTYPITAVDHNAGTISFTYEQANGTALTGTFGQKARLLFSSSKLAVVDASKFAIGDTIQLEPDAQLVVMSVPSQHGATPATSALQKTSLHASLMSVTEIDLQNNLLKLNGATLRTDNLCAGYQDAVSTVAKSAGGLKTRQAKATYDSARRRYTSFIPLSSTSKNGGGATARLEFSPLPLGKKLAIDGSSTTVTDSNFQHYNRVEFGRGAQPINKGSREYLYGEFWEGSEYNRKGSAENSRYGGLQASGSRLVKGFSGAIQGGRQADVYFPDYGFISVYFNTGANAVHMGQFTRVDVPVTSETNTTTNITSKYIQFQLKPTARAKKATAFAGTTKFTNLDLPDELPETVAPTIRINLTECPDTWIVDDSECRPTHVKENSQNRLPWFSLGSNMERPVVDIPRNASGDIDANSVTIVDGGSGWESGTKFTIRLFQANAYYQRNDFNTASSPTYIKGGHPRSGQFVQFSFNANSPDNNTPHGPPHTLIQPCLVGNPGNGYSSSDSGTVQLMSRAVESELSTAVDRNLITFEARVLETLTASNQNGISDVQIISGGSNYFVTPEILIRHGKGGYGLKVIPTLSEAGRIEKVEVVDGGLGYTINPELYTESRPAMLSAKMRPAMRGRYRCAYRFVDRRKTVVGTVEVRAADQGLADAPTTLDLLPADTELEPGYILESDSLPHHARVVSVHGDGQVEINQDHGLYRLAHSATFGRVFVQETVHDFSTGLDVQQNVLDSDGNPILDYATFTVSDNRGIKAGQQIIIDPETVAGTVHSISGNVIRLSQDIAGYVIGTAYTIRIEDVVTATIRDLTKPICYSDLSPIIDVDAGPNEDRTHSSEMIWNLTGVNPPERADKVELWRTSADQSLVFYRAESYGKPSLDGVEIVGKDTLTDEELFDADRPHYAALPVVLPNGGVNAYRFGKPRSDMSVAVAFQDRLWMGVSTSGEDLNTLYYSEFDEFESLPDVNELPIQNNQKSTDVLVGLVPFGSMLLAMQHTHTYALTYNSDPGLDASVQLLTHRGVLHQRCWDIHENVLYAADESGIYAMARNGEVSDVSLPVRDLFVSEIIDFSKRETFFLQTDPRTHILRFFCTFKSQASETPPQAICFDIQARTWWTESYPTSMTAAVTGRPDKQAVNTILFGSDDGNIYELKDDRDHSTQSITDTLVTNGGRGYREAPEITVPNVVGAKVQGVVSEGQLVDVVIQDSGWYAKQGINILSEDGLAIADHATQNIQGAEYASIALDIGPPVDGGIQAVAEANFSVNPEVKRFGTVAQGESFVRIEPPRVAQSESSDAIIIGTESGLEFITEDNNSGSHGPNYLIATQPQHIRIGMECIGDFVPINCFVTKIDRLDIHLAHPDGTPAIILGGDARTNQAGTDETFLELGGTRVFLRFIDPCHTHIPFRAVSGFSQQVNADIDQRAGGEIEKSVTVVYDPTKGNKEIELIERFNGQEEMRANGMRRSRGGPGTFEHRQDSASTVLNTNKSASSLGFATGVAQAKFASRATADLTGADQYVQWELYGRPDRCDQKQRTNFWESDNTVRLPLPVTIHSVTIEGVVDGE